MLFYIFLDENHKTENFDSINILGDLSFNTFYTELGWKAFKKIIDTNNLDLILRLSIKDEKDKEYSIDEFLSKLKDKNILEN